jgi:serine/threonine-protein kinase SRPK3
MVLTFALSPMFLGENIRSLRRRLPNGQRIFPVAVAKRIIKQTLLALDYLHRECGLVHTGIFSSFQYGSVQLTTRFSDVKPDNITVCIDHSDAAITPLFREIPSATYDPRFEPDISPDPIITVKSQPLPNFGLRQDASNLNICLIDYSHGKRSHMQTMVSYLFHYLQQNLSRMTFKAGSTHSPPC